MPALDGLINQNTKLIWASDLLLKHLPQTALPISVQLPAKMQEGQPAMLTFQGKDFQRDLLLCLTVLPEGMMGCWITPLPQHSKRVPWQHQNRLLALQEAAYRDGLTDLLNRRAFEEHLENHMQLPEQFSLIVIDLDGLKHVNDSLGHEAGDDFLQTFARVLQEQLRTTDTPFRIGGDEFAVIMQDLEASQVHIVEKRLEAVRSEVRARWNPDCDFSAGVSFFPQESSHDAKLLQHLADERMYQNKSGKKAAVRLPSGDHPQLVSTINRKAVFLSQQATLELLASGQAPDPAYWQLMLEYAIQMVPSAQAGSLNLWDGKGFVQVAQVGFDPGIVGVRFTLEAQKAWYGNSETDWRAGIPRLLRGAETITAHSRASGNLADDSVVFHESAGRLQDITCNVTAPICHEGRVYGHLSLDNFVGPDAFTEESRLAAIEMVQQCATVCRLLGLEGH